MPITVVLVSLLLATWGLSLWFLATRYMQHELTAERLERGAACRATMLSALSPLVLGVTFDDEAYETSVRAVNTAMQDLRELDATRLTHQRHSVPAAEFMQSVLAVTTQVLVDTEVDLFMRWPSGTRYLNIACYNSVIGQVIKYSNQGEVQLTTGQIRAIIATAQQVQQRAA